MQIMHLDRNSVQLHYVTYFLVFAVHCNILE